MRRRKAQSIKDVVEELLKVQHLDKKLGEKNLLIAWDEVVGASINKYCISKYIKNKVLYVKLNSSVLRNELMMSREKLVENLNKKVGANIIVDIHFN